MKNRILLIVVFVLSWVCGIGQNTTHQLTSEDSIVKPAFPGSYLQYLKDSIRYPSEDKKAGRQGTVYMNFVVEKDGTITNVRPVKEIAGAPDLTKEAKRVISAMPKWIPGTLNGKPIRSQLVQPVKFVLQDEVTTDSLAQKVVPCGTQIPEDSLGTILDFTEKMPEVKGGLSSYLKEIKLDQKPECAGGRVNITFIVMEDGKLVNIQINGMENCPILHQSIINAMCEMPNWEPGIHNNIPVKVRMTTPITLN